MFIRRNTSKDYPLKSYHSRDLISLQCPCIAEDIEIAEKYMVEQEPLE